VIVEQVTNGVAIRMAVLYLLLSGSNDTSTDTAGSSDTSADTAGSSDTSPGSRAGMASNDTTNLTEETIA
jgi:hypothetical protein